MDWYIVDKDYVNYLLQFDSRVGYVEYGEKIKLHVGILLRINSFCYYVPISSPKKKHKRMHNGLDFHKLENHATSHLYAVLNLNNMIPVPDQCIEKLQYNNIQNYCSFSNEQNLHNYVYLLQQEKKIIDKNNFILQKKAQKLYQKCLQNPESSLAKRCCNFALLEEKCKLYKSEKQ